MEKKENAGTENEEISSFKQWYRRSFIVRKYLLPATGGFLTFLIPLFYQLKLFGDDTRLIIYIVAVSIAALIAVVYRNMEQNEEAHFKTLAERYKKEAEHADLALRDQIRIFSHVKHIVEEKSHRFVKLCKKIDGDEKLKKDDVFATITQPLVQIDLILEGLARFFSHGREERLVEIVLYKPNGTKGHFEYFRYFPKDRKPPIPEGDFKLNHGVPGFALRRNGIVVVEDIEADIKGKNPTFFWPDNTQVAPKGSVVCYPIRDNERDVMAFVLSVYVNEPKFFKEEAKEHLQDVVLMPFVQRILLEDRLNCLKENAQ